MAKLVTQEPTPAPSTSTAPAAGVLTPDRWLAVIALGAFAFLVVTRRAFREFIPGA